jgi:hypothetical protein
MSSGTTYRQVFGQLKTAELLAKTDDERSRLDEARQKLIAECDARGEKEAQACRYAAAG